MDDDFYISNDRENSDDMFVYIAYKPKNSNATYDFPPQSTRYVILGTSEQDINNFVCLVFHKYIDDSYSSGELCVLPNKKIIKNLYIDGFISRDFVIDKAYKECMYYAVNAASKRPFYGHKITIDRVEECMGFLLKL